VDFQKLTEKQQNQVAKGFDATPELIPFIPYLLQDLFELGSSPEIIIEILKSLNLKKDSKILDLACGKGAVSISIAKEFGFHTLGVDLFEPFIEEAKQKLTQMNLENLCTFEVEDVATSISTRKDFDVVILASAETLLGYIDESIKALRECIKSKGYIIFDGCYMIEESSLKNPDYAVLKNYDETIKLLTAHGDTIIKEVELSLNETKVINDGYTNLIRKRANELATKFPDKNELLLEYVKKQEEECQIIENETVGCVWCLQKNN